MKINQAAAFGVIALIFTLPVRAQSDLPSGYGVTENQNFDQASTATPTADPSTPDQFYASVYTGSTGTILTSSTLTPPAGRTGIVTFTQTGSGIYFQQDFSTLSAMDAAFGAGTYNLTVNTSTPNTYHDTITLATDDLSSIPIPQISNTTWSGGTLTFDPTKSLTLNFNNNSGGNMGLTIFNSTVNVGFYTGTTSYTVPANTLSANTVYQCLLQYNDPSNGGYQRSTHFTIGTNDVGGYGFAKEASYDQTSAATPTLDGNSPYQFYSYINPGTNGALFANASLTTPLGGTGAVSYVAGSQGLSFNENFTSKTTLDTAFPDGSGSAGGSGEYNLTVQTTTPNNYTDQFTFGSDNYPSVPKITSMTNATWGSNGALLVTNINQAVTITFSNPNGAYANLNVNNTNLSNMGANGLTSFTIPAGTFSNNTFYNADIQLDDGSGTGATDSETLPNPNGGTATYQTEVNFTIQTGTPSTSSSTYNEVFKSHVQVQTSASGPVDGTGDPNYSDPAPYNLDITNASSGTVTGPSSTSFALGYVADGGDNDAGDYEYSSGALTSLSALNSAAPDGTYTFPGGTTVSLTGDGYPTAPTVLYVNGGTPVWDAQGQLVLNPLIANVITWSSVTVPNFSTNGHESVYIDSNDDNFDSIDQEAQSSPFTTITIPADSMTAGYAYFGSIQYYALPSFSNPSTNVYYVGGYVTETDFTIIANYTTGLLQAINFPAIANQTVGAAPFTISATATSGLPVTFSVVSGPATLSGTNNSTVTLTGAGTVVIQASQAGTSPYAAAANVTQSFVVGMASQTITFPSLSSQQVAGTSVTLGATASSGLAVTYQITGPATLSGSMLTFTGTGTVTVEAEQTGNSSYSAATPITQTLNVVAAPDVGFYSIQKVTLYDQSSASTPTLDAQQPFQFSSNINYGTTGSVLTSSSLTPPVPSTGTVSYQTNTSNQLYFQASFLTSGALDAAFDSGTYNFVINTSTPNSYNAQITLGADNYPSVPKITSMTNATWNNGILVVTNYALAVTLTWSNTSSASAYFQLNNTGISSNGSSITTTYTIPAGELSNNTLYQGQISLSNYGTVSTSIPNVNGQPSYQTQVDFIMQTGSPSAASKLQYVVQKKYVLEQASNSAPVPGSGEINNSDPAPYDMSIESPASGTVSGPSSTSFALTYDIYDSDYENQSGAYASQSLLNTAYPDGTYTVGGNALSLTGDSYPGTTQVTQVNGSTPVWDAQGQLALNPTVSNTITWSAVTVPSFSTDGHETAEFESTNGGSVDVKTTTGIGKTTTTPFTTLTIPANTMTTTDTYQFYVNYGQATQYYTVGSNGLAAALYETETELTAVALIPQTITFPTISSQVAGGMLTLSATASSGLGVSYSVISGPATLSGSTLTFTGAGTVTVQVSQTGNGTYASVPGETQSFTVNAAPTPATDTPTMPPWAVLVLGALLFLGAGRVLKEQARSEHG